MAIGYVPQGETELKEAVKEAFGKIKEKMESPWPQVVGVFDAEWIGPDEVAALKSLAKKLKECYQSCVEIINEVQENIDKVHESWKTFQEGFQIENGESAEKGTIAELEPIKVDVTDPELKVESRTYPASEFLGIQDADSSRTKCHEANANYATTVKQSVQDLFASIEVNKAYFGDLQTEAMKGLIERTSEVLANLTTAFKDVDDAITGANGAIHKFAEQEKTVAEEEKGYTPDSGSSNNYMAE